MKADIRKLKVSVPQGLQSPNWSSKTLERLQAATWVSLRELPNPYSHNEALLLCQHSETEWIVWIPEHGEIILHHSAFGEAY